MRETRLPIHWTVLLAAMGASSTAAPSSAQLGPDGNQLWTQDSSGIEDLAEAEDMYGNALATGDFNDDGYDDLAIGVAHEEFVGGADVGAVAILYGGPDGPSALFDDLWHQDSAGINGVSEAGDRFGFSLAAGDFDDDGYDDLAIGIPYEEVGGAVEAGAVQILYGSSVGLAASGNQLWFQDDPGIPGSSEEGDQFGWALAAADFELDGYDDLAIGAPGEDLDGGQAGGAVYILRGSVGGLTSDFSQDWSQDSAGILDNVEEFDAFGRTLTAGDFNGDFFADLVVGAPFEDTNDFISVGMVHILYGSSTGLSATGNEVLSQDSAGIPDAGEDFDRFGSSLAAGDFDGDQFDDLGVGVVEDFGAAFFAGAVHVVYGTADGLFPATAGNQFWTQDSPGVAGVIEAGDEFGASLAAGDFSGDGFDDLAIGAPGEGIGDLGNAGSLHVLHGTGAGLSATGSQYWDQDSPDMLGTVESNDYFASVLTTGDFDGDSRVDLAIGIPEEDVEALEDAGAVQILFRQAGIFSDGFESGDTLEWSGTVP